MLVAIAVRVAVALDVAAVGLCVDSQRHGLSGTWRVATESWGPPTR
jgi:hypothetical protein